MPLVAVSFSVLKAFGAHYRIEPVLLSALEPLSPRNAEVSRRVVGFVNNTQVGALGAVGLVGLLYMVLSLIDRIEEALNHIWQVRRIELSVSLPHQRFVSVSRSYRWARDNRHCQAAPLPSTRSPASLSSSPR